MLVPRCAVGTALWELLNERSSYVVTTRILPGRDLMGAVLTGLARWGQQAGHEPVLSCTCLSKRASGTEQISTAGPRFPVSIDKL